MSKWQKKTGVHGVVSGLQELTLKLKYLAVVKQMKRAELIRLAVLKSKT